MVVMCDLYIGMVSSKAGEDIGIEVENLRGGMDDGRVIGSSGDAEDIYIAGEIEKYRKLVKL